MNKMELDDYTNKTKKISIIIQSLIYSGIILFIISVILFFINISLKNQIITYCLMCIFILGSILFITSQILISKLSKWHLNQVLLAFHRINIDGIFTYKNIIPAKEIVKDSKIFEINYDTQARITNYMTGKYIDVSFISFYLSINTNEKLSFDGDFYKIKYSSQHKVIIKNKSFNLPTKLTKQHTSNNEFNQRYDIFCDDINYTNSIFNNDSINIFLNLHNLEFLYYDDFLYIGLKTDYDFINTIDIIEHINDDLPTDFANICRFLNIMKG